MRPEGQEKLGYYPTPLVEMDRVASLLNAAPGLIRVLDPCAGGGEAVAHLAQAVERHDTKVETWGAELSPQRAEKAAARLDRVLPTAWEHSVCPRSSVSLCFVNPPYDDVGWGEHGRVEAAFLTSCTPKLVSGGILVYIIPERILANPQVSRHLTGWYEDVTILRFTPREYESFGQVIVVGRRRDGHERRRLALPPVLNDLREELAGRYAVPAAPRLPASRFYYRPVTGDDVRRALRRSPLAGKVAQTLRPARRAVQRPALPLKRGHLAMLLSAGLIPALRLEGKEGPFLLKGGVIKTHRIRVSEDVLEQARKAQRREVEGQVEEDFKTVLVRASAAGAEVIQEAGEVIAFLKQWMGEIFEQIVDRPEMSPLYNFDPTNDEWHVLDRVVRTRTLPGMDEPGLLPSQRHVDVALGRLLRKKGRAILNGEMGFGKSFIAASLPLVLEAGGETPWPVLVACPAHLVDQWAAEIKEAVPLAVVRVIRPAFHRNRAEAARACQRLRRGSSHDCSLVQFVRDWEAGCLGQRAYAVISYTMLKLGAGFEPAAVEQVATRQMEPEDGVVIEPGQRYLACPGCGAAVVVKPRGEETLRAALWEDLEQSPRRCRSPVERIAGNPETGEIGFGVLDGEGQPHICNTPLFSWTHLRRWPAQRGLRHWRIFGLFVADEVHKAQGGSTDVGIAVGNTAGVAQFATGMTGTLFGGKSKSLFYNAFRFAPQVREDFGYRDAEAWSALYGRRAFSVVVSREDAESGFFNGYIRRISSFEERPGVSPAVLAYLLPSAVFVTLADLGYQLPPYAEELIGVPMTSGQIEQYRAIDAAIKSRMESEGRSRYLALWLQWLLNRPDTAFRPERVVGKISVGWEGRGQVIEEVDFGSLEPVVGEGELLPKEKWLTGFCCTELAAGRRVLVYVRLTGERDIQPRLVRVLRSAGIEVEVLRRQVSPRRRPEWVRRHLPDVLVTNPKLVETGVNLIEYPTVVFLQIDYSLFTVWQAVRRTWRLGQEQPVKVLYVSHTTQGSGPCMEERAVALVGEKLAAAQLLYGEEVSGAIVPDVEDSILDELARDALRNRPIPHLEALFARENRGLSSRPASIAAASETIHVPSFTGGNGGRKQQLTAVAPAPVDLSRVKQGRLV